MKCTRRNFLLGTIGLTAASPLLAQSLSVQCPIPHTLLKSSSYTDLSLLLRCIAMVETGTKENPDGDDTRVGPSGERSKYQITFNVWKQHQDLTHDDSEWMKWYWQQCCNGEDAKHIAMRHIRWLDKTLPRKSALEREMREYVLAWAWNGGASSWNTHLSTGSYLNGWNNVKYNNYATRVSNLYSDFKKA
jgi:hypothetical protein